MLTVNTAKVLFSAETMKRKAQMPGITQIYRQKIRFIPASFLQNTYLYIPLIKETDMDIFLIILGFLCLVGGLIGCILPMLPGPPLAYTGLLLLHFTDHVQFSTSQLLIWLLLVAVIQALDYFVPLLGTKYSGGSRWGTHGCFIGTIIGLFFMPWGIIVGPFAGAFIGELLGGKETIQALKSGMGSLLGFLFGTVIKCILCAYFIWQFGKALW